MVVLPNSQLVFAGVGVQVRRNSTFNCRISPGITPPLPFRCKQLIGYSSSGITQNGCNFFNAAFLLVSLGSYQLWNTNNRCMQGWFKVVQTSVETLLHVRICLHATKCFPIQYWHWLSFRILLASQILEALEMRMCRKWYGDWSTSVIKWGIAF